MRFRCVVPLYRTRLHLYLREYRNKQTILSGRGGVNINGAYQTGLEAGYLAGEFICSRASQCELRRLKTKFH